MSRAYPNPLIPGFNPDPSCVRVDGVYYLVTSSFEYLPAIAIYRSTDFVTWDHIGHVTHDPDAAGIVDGRSGMGVWAPTIRHHAGLFHVIVSVAESSRGCVVFTAADPAGPWSGGTTIDGIDGIDPDLAWDEDGTAYVTYSALRLTGPGRGRHDGIEQVPVDLAAARALAKPVSLWSGTGLHFPEAPHLYRRDGYWYLLLAEGGTERGHAVSVARSASITGPFEPAPTNPILRATGTGRPVQNTGHADLVPGPDGTDLFVALGVQPLGAGDGFSPLGRETFVTTVDWVDGWPVAAPIMPVARPGVREEHFPLADADELVDTGWLAVGRAPVQVGVIADGALQLTGEGDGMGALRPVFLGRRQRHLNSDTAVRIAPGTGEGGMALRYDERFHITLSARSSATGRIEVAAAATVPGLHQEWIRVFPGETITLRIRTRRPVRTMANDASGGDRILLEAVPDGASPELIAELDGRFWTAEVAASFTGRVTGPFARTGTVRFHDYTYRGADDAAALDALTRDEHPPMNFTARMITADTARGCAPQLRGEFTLATGHGPVASATLYATALGLCDVTLNGRPASLDVLTPGWSSYEWRVRYAEWDVQTHLQERNVLGILIGNGWYAGHLGFAGGKGLYGAEPAAWAELRIIFADGHVQTVSTDTSWQSGPSPVLADDLYHGQTIDARRRDSAWARPGVIPDGWSGVREVAFDRARLTPYIAPPVRRQEEVAPVRVWSTPAGATLVDFGQNLVGWIRLTGRGRSGETVILRHAEVLEHDELGTRPLRLAKATDRYTFSGGDDVFEPTLTFHGFRYVEVTGWSGTDAELADALRAIVIGSDLRRIGTFDCSDPLLNQLHSNVVWGMRGNFVDVPTDCPQRDERLGWTGDLAAFIDTAAYLYDVDAFLRDWLLDLAAEQTHADGNIPVVVPDNIKYEEVTGLIPGADADVQLIALWNDAACWVPWGIWQAYGDRGVLEQQYESMAACTRRIATALSGRHLLEGGIQLGDWLDPTAPPDEPYKGKSDPYVVATACVYHSVDIAARAADLLGRTSDAGEFHALATRIRVAFNTHWVKEGRVHSDAAAVYALAICFGLLDEADTDAAGHRLSELAAESGHTITTGFAGTPFINFALSQTGHLDTAYRLLLQTDCPSWLYPVTMGATTMWERWDSMLPDGTINPGEMTSFNHYAFGAIANWMHQVVAGLAPLAPGYARILIAPQPGGGLTWAAASLETPHGRAAVHWEIDGDHLSVDATIPPGTTAVLRLPGADETTIGAGQHTFRVPRVLQSTPNREAAQR